MERYLKSRYKIGEKISENPFSATYRGSFIGTNKPVVIKIYKRGTLNSSLINRMKQKVRELSLINHHGLAKLIDGDYGWQGFYYVREYVEGKSLKELLKEKKEFGAEKAATVAAEVCRALEPVHKKGIIHGALKPSNIFIDAKGIVKVADFIIEGEIKEAMPQKPMLIVDNGKYISPEELAGQPATASSDVFSLGMILYELLTLKNLLPESSLAGSLSKLRRQTIVGREELEVLPKYLRDLVGKALQADPLLRFSSIGEFRQSIENKSLADETPAQDEYTKIFESSVLRYGEEEISKESESLKDLGRVRLRWGKEKHRNWILAVILAIAVLSGILYAFLFGI
ncbi:serine/threonine protein kinase [Candidatus Margulisiibacteriota bacterium]